MKGYEFIKSLKGMWLKSKLHLDPLTLANIFIRLLTIYILMIFSTFVQFDKMTKFDT